MSERDDYEAGLNPRARIRNEHGDYVLPSIQDRWAGWQARAARTATAEQAEPVAEMKGSYLYPLKSIPSGTKLYTAPDALQGEVSKNKLLRAQLETVRLQRDKELKEKCEALNELERLREEVDQLKNSNKGCEDCFIEMRDERDALKADAERYRWLRRKSRNNIVVRNGVSHLFDELLDRSIDAARTAKPEVKS